MKLNFGCSINKEGFSGGVDYETLLSYKDKEEQIKKGVFESDKAMLGWLDSPYIAIDELNDVKRYAKFINENYTSFVVFGIGGSALGAIALNSAIGKDRNSGTKVLVVVEKFHDCWDEYVSLAEAAIFEYAFKLGLQIAIETLK